MADYSGFTVDQVYNIIMGADPQTLADAASDFKGAWEALKKIPEDMDVLSKAVAGAEDIWLGPAANAFLAFQEKVGQYFLEANAPAQGYEGVLTTAKGALDVAIKEITDLKKDWDDEPPTTIYTEQYNQVARNILVRLGNAYVTAGNNMGELAKDPEQLEEINDQANKEKDAKEEEEKDAKEEDEEGGKEEDEEGGKEEDEEGGKEEENKEQKDGGGSGTSGKGPEESESKDKPKDKPKDEPKDEPKDQPKGTGPTDDGKGKDVTLPPQGQSSNLVKEPKGGGGSGSDKGSPPKDPAKGGSDKGSPPKDPGKGGSDTSGKKPGDPISPRTPGKDPSSDRSGTPPKDPSSPSKTLPFDPGTPPKSNLQFPGDGPGGGKGLGGTPISDSFRTLPDAPVKEFPGRPDIKGIDIDGDGDPDLGFDGKPLKGDIVVGPDGKLGIDVDGDGKPDIPLTIGKDGKIGLDVNGDGKPDIGLDGEILDTTPLVQGPDGTIGIDVDGDGKPDIAISGQVLPDAPIKTFEDVRGVDVDGDGKPDVGMDRRPTRFATIIEKDGLRGVDVNNDDKPDIGEDGQIFEKNAPIETSKDGIKGVDVNGDGKPDIALTGGQSVDPLKFRDSIPGPQLPLEFPGVGLEPRIPSVPVEPRFELYQPSNDDNYSSLNSLGRADSYNVPSLRATTGDFDDPGTTLTGLGLLSPTAPSVAPTPVVDPIGSQAIGSPPSTTPGIAGVVGGVSSRYNISPKTARQADQETYLTGGATGVEPPPGPVPVRTSAPLTPYLGGMAGGVYGGDSDAKKAERQTKLTEDDDVWQDSGGADDSLGRPRR